MASIAISKVLHAAKLKPLGSALPKSLERYKHFAAGLFRLLPPIKIKTEEIGKFGSKEYRQFFKDESGEKISPWHDIPRYASENRLLLDTEELVLNYITECPRGTRQKMEMSLEAEWNPILQDTKNGELRYLKWAPVLFNYGFVPQTWEDPNIQDPDTGKGGDNDPLDVVDIGRRMCARGEIVRARVLGALALIDEGETDWKIIVCNIEDPLIRWINNINQAEEKKQGFPYAIREYFRNYKIPDGKPQNTFAFNEKFLPKEKAFEIIETHHNHWKKLLQTGSDKVSLKRKGS